MEILKTLQSRIDSLSLRERGIVQFGTIAVVYLLFDFFLLEPLAIEQRRVLGEIELNNAEVLNLNTHLMEITSSSSIDPNVANREKLKQLKLQLARLDEQLQLTTAHMVPPKEMTKLLEMVLSRTQGLRLHKVNSLGTSLLVANEEAKVDGSTESDAAVSEEANSLVSTAYRHGLKIEFSGDFPNTLNYLRRLEELEWKFFWDKIEFEVNEYPDSVGAISVFTISMDEHWIGV